MAEQETQTRQTSSSTSSPGKSAGKSGPKRGPGLARVQGENASDPRPAEQQPGTPEHLGSDRPYEGGESPFVEGDESARNR